MLKINNKNVFIRHCVYKYDGSPNGIVTIRNTKKQEPLPIKFNKLLLKKYLKFWQVNFIIKRFKKFVKFEYTFNIPLEFTIGTCPEEHIKVITICHPTDTFKKKIGVKIIKDRMKWALEHPYYERFWLYRLKR